MSGFTNLGRRGGWIVEVDLSAGYGFYQVDEDSDDEEDDGELWFSVVDGKPTVHEMVGNHPLPAEVVQMLEQHNIVVPEMFVK